MKILCVIDSLGSGGAQRQLVELALGFKERGHEVSFLVYHQLNFYKETLDDNDILVHEIIEPNYLKRLLKMRKFIRGGGYDAVLSFLEAANFICELAGFPWRKWKLIVGERSANPEILKSLKLRIFRWFHLLADYVVANSHENIRIVRKVNPFLSSKKCYVIYNMIDFKKWKPTTDYVPFKNNKFNLTVVASFGYVKNLHGLVEAVSLLSNKNLEKLLISWYGRADNIYHLDEVKDKIKRMKLEKHFLFSPPTLDIIKHMQEADAIGLFSHYEGLPNAICEGMALGKPVIATNISDLPLIVKDKNLLADSISPKSIASIIEYYINLSKEQLIEEGKYNRIKAEELFNKNEILTSYISLLKKQYK